MDMNVLSARFLTGFSSKAYYARKRGDIPTTNGSSKESERTATKVDQTGSIVLQDQSFFVRSFNYIFSDIIYAFKPYDYGKFSGPPSPLAASQGSKSTAAFKPNVSARDFQNGNVDEALIDEKEQKSTVRNIVKRIAGNAGMKTIRFLAWSLPKVFRTAFESIHVSGAENFKMTCEDVEISYRNSDFTKRKVVVLLPTHRSHVDYLLLSFVCFGFNLPMPFIAAGENLNIFLIGRLLSQGGAFFIQRAGSNSESKSSLKNILTVDERKKEVKKEVYKKILTQYIHHLLKQGYPVEVFIEGGRTRTGFASDPKLGLLKTILNLINDDTSCSEIDDVLIIPVSLDYENVVENISSGVGPSKGSGYAAYLLGEPKSPESFLALVKLGLRLIFFGSSFSHGKVFVKFGKQISVKDYMSDRLKEKERVNEELLALGNSIVNAQRELATISTVGILSFILLNISEIEYNRAKEAALATGSHINIPDIFNALFNLGSTNRVRNELIIRFIIPKFKVLSSFLFDLVQSGESSFAIDLNKETLLDDATLLSEIYRAMDVLDNLIKKRLNHDKRENAYIADAKFRMDLQYCGGQLGVILIPYSLAALKLSDELSALAESEVFKNSLKGYFLGADVSASAVDVARRHINAFDPESILLDVLVTHIMPVANALQIVSEVKKSEFQESETVPSAGNLQTLALAAVQEGKLTTPEVLNRMLLTSVAKQLISTKDFTLATLGRMKQRLVSSHELASSLSDVSFTTWKRARRLFFSCAFIFLLWAKFRRIKQ